MLDFNEIIPERLWVGCYPQEEDLSQIQQLAITTVVSLQDQRDIVHLGISLEKLNCAYIQAGIKFRRVAVKDFDTKDLLQKLTRCVAEIEAALAHGSARVYLHCTAGMNRAPTAAAAYMIRSMGMSAQQAYDYVVTRRYCRPYLAVLEDYAAALKETAPGDGSRT